MKNQSVQGRVFRLMAIAAAIQLTACGKGANSAVQPESSGVTAGTASAAEGSESSEPALNADNSVGVSLSQGSGSGLTVVLQGTKNVSASELEKLKQAVTAVNQVINSPQFRDKVLNFSFNGAPQFAQNNGMTNQQIYDFIMAGAEKYPTQQAPNHIADLFIAGYSPPWYRSFTSAVAFTNSNDQYEYLYNKYFSGASVPEIANTIIHEWTHRMGFSHDFNATAQRPYSVPYGIGGLVESSVKTYLGQ